MSSESASPLSIPLFQPIPTLEPLEPLEDTLRSSFRQCVTTPFAIQVIEESVEELHEFPLIGDRENRLDGARIVANPSFFLGIQEIVNKYGFPGRLSLTAKTEIPFTQNYCHAVHKYSPSGSAAVDLSDTSLNLKDGAEEAWHKMFETKLEELVRADSSKKLRNKLRLLLVNYYLDNRIRKYFPKSFRTLLTDLRENSLTYLQKKYFPTHGRMRARSSNLEALDLVSSSPKVQVSPLNHSDHYPFQIMIPAKASLPGFVTTFLQIFNNETSIPIEAMYEREQEEIIHDILENQCSNRVVKKDEALRLLIHQKGTSRLLKGNKFNAHVLTTDKITPFLKKTMQSPSLQDNHRFQILVRGVAHHYTALDIELKNGHWNCFIMDASNSMELRNIKEQLHEAGVEKIIEAFTPQVEGLEKELQADKHNCWVFAFDHIVQSSKIDIFKLLNEKCDALDSCYTRISWLDLPRHFIRNAQSTHILNLYSTLNPAEWASPHKGFSSFREYMDTQVQEVVIKEERRPVNASTVLKAEVYRGKIRSAISSLSSAEIANIVFEGPI
ncbi:MAG: hypothetical protein ACI9S8_001785 [Chlamydiales bacterium]|jgi:hypothetical protein